MVAVLSRSGNSHREALQGWLEESGAVGYAKQRAGRFVERAGKELEGIRPSPARDALMQIAAFVVDREQ